MITPHTATTLDQVALRRNFPRRKAFVLRFAADAGPQTGRFRGRIEHVASGDQVWFDTTDEFWSFVRKAMAATEDQVVALPRVGSGRTGAQLPAQG